MLHIFLNVCSRIDVVRYILFAYVWMCAYESEVYQCVICNNMKKILVTQAIFFPKI